MVGRTTGWRAAVLAATLLGVSACDALKPPTPEEQFEQAIAADPAFAGVFDVLREEFPRDFSRFRRQIVLTVENGGDGQQAFEVARSFMLEFVRTNSADFAAAPDSALLATRDANIALIEQLAADDEQLCGNFAMRGLQFGDVPSQAAKEQLGRVTALHLRAIAAGRREPTPRGDPTESDVGAFVDALRMHGMQDSEIDAFLAGTLVTNTYAPADECRMGLALYRSMASLPDDASGRLAAVMLVPTQ